MFPFPINVRTASERPAFGVCAVPKTSALEPK